MILKHFFFKIIWEFLIKLFYINSSHLNDLKNSKNLFFKKILKKRKQKNGNRNLFSMFF
jgi:hypothetical protein